MRVLAIDPGYDRLGVAIMEKVDGKEKILHSACLTTNKTEEHNERLAELGIKLRAILDKYEPECVAIETLFFNQNRSTAIKVAEVRGMVIHLAKERNCDVREFGPQEIKVAVTGYGKSDKRAVIDMVKRLIPESPKQALDDEYDAIAIGITCLAHTPNLS